MAVTDIAGDAFFHGDLQFAESTPRSAAHAESPASRQTPTPSRPEGLRYYRELDVGLQQFRRGLSGLAASDAGAGARPTGPKGGRQA